MEAFRKSITNAIGIIDEKIFFKQLTIIRYNRRIAVVTESLLRGIREGTKRDTPHTLHIQRREETDRREGGKQTGGISTHKQIHQQEVISMEDIIVYFAKLYEQILANRRNEDYEVNPVQMERFLAILRFFRGKVDPKFDEGIKLISHGPKVIRFRIIEIIHSYLHPHNKRPHLPTIAVSLS